MPLKFTPYPLVAGRRALIRGRARPLSPLALRLNGWPLEPASPGLLSTVHRPGGLIVDPFHGESYRLIADGDGSFELAVMIPDNLAEGEHLIEVHDPGDRDLVYGAVVTIRWQGPGSFYDDLFPESAGMACEPSDYQGADPGCEGAEAPEPGEDGKPNCFEGSGPGETELRLPMPSGYIPPTYQRPFTYMTLADEDWYVPLSQGRSWQPRDRASEPPEAQRLRVRPGRARAGTRATPASVAPMAKEGGPPDPPEPPEPLPSVISLAQSPWPEHHTDRYNSDHADLDGSGNYAANGPLEWGTVLEVGDRFSRFNERIACGATGPSVGAGNALYWACGDTLALIDAATGLPRDWICSMSVRSYIEDGGCLNDCEFMIFMQPSVISEDGIEKIFFNSGGQIFKYRNQDMRLFYENHVDIRDPTTGAAMFVTGYVTSAENPRLLIFGAQATSTSEEGTGWDPHAPEGPGCKNTPCGGTRLYVVDMQSCEVLDTFDLAHYFVGLDFVREHPEGIDLSNHPVLSEEKGETDPLFERRFETYNDIYLTNSLALGPDLRSNDGERPSGRLELLYGIILESYLFAVGLNPNPLPGQRYFYNAPFVEWRQYYAPEKSGSSPALSKRIGASCAHLVCDLRACEERSCSGDRIYILTGTGSVSPNLAEDGGSTLPFAFANLWAVDALTGRVMDVTEELGPTAASCVVSQTSPPEVYVNVMGRGIFGFVDEIEDGESNLRCSWRTSPEVRTMGTNAALVGDYYYTPFFVIRPFDLGDIPTVAAYAGAWDTTDLGPPESCSDDPCLAACGPVPNWGYVTYTLDRATKAVNDLSEANARYGQVYFVTIDHLYSFESRNIADI